MSKTDVIEPVDIVYNVNSYRDEHDCKIDELIIHVGVEGRRVSMGVQDMPHQEWLSRNISRLVKEAYEIGFREGRDAVRKKLKEALG